MTFKKMLDAQLAARLAEGPTGIAGTKVDGVRVFWTTKSSPPEPLVYDAGIVLLLQGRKEGRLGDRTFIYDENNYLVLTMMMPFLCAHVASRKRPLCGLFVSASREDLVSLLGQMSEVEPLKAKAGQSALAPARVETAMRDTLVRMLAVLDDELAGRVIGPGLRRELLFHALRGPRGSALAAYAQKTGDDGKLDKVIESLRHDIARTVTIESMADSVGMSPSAFHRAFKRRTGQPPLQYVKRLRLHAARDLIAFSGVRIGEAARRVGYESASQFSREFKRHFKVPASEYNEFDEV